MGISRRLAGQLSRSSWIRIMFERGIELKARFGADRVADLSIGNPHLDPPAPFHERLRELAEHPIPGMHGYMVNAGYPETREAVAGYLSRRTGLPFDSRHVVMTIGAGGGMNVLLKTVLDPKAKVLVPSPFFPEYEFYAEAHGATLVPVPSRPDFTLDVPAMERAMGPDVAAIILNSPNNPTGVVYGEEELTALAEAVKRKETEHGHDILLLSDEPYRRILYEGTVPWIFRFHPNSAVVTSYSKDLNLAGERIGYVALHPEMPDGADVFRGMVFNQRALGMVSAPALLQRLVTGLQDVTVDVAEYRRKRDLLCAELPRMGYRVVCPRGAFYLFPEAPGGDDVRFLERLQEERVLGVPGVAFGRPGHFRLSFAVPDEVVRRALPGLERAARSFR
ncbi:MAG: pyridoxal phosphate-dependent aminotransferase [Planctomycetes bacterium]|nr:pyridoxal phosphate-dependent aminotransferase [Planctomycetota bacterium]